MSARRIVSSLMPQTLDAESSQGVSTLALEASLRKLCDALLELLPEHDSAERSVLSDVVPSLLPCICSCLPSTHSIQQELQQWEQRSQQLIRLATLHGGSSETELIRSLESTSQLANRAIRSIDSLKAWRPESWRQEVSSVEQPSVCVESTTDRAAESHLRELCVVLMGLLESSPDHGSVLAQTMPSLLHIVVDCDDSSLERLKEERRNHETSATQLLAIAATHSVNAANELRQRVARSLASAARAIRALEAMQARSLPRSEEASDRFAENPDSNRDLAESDRQRAAEIYQQAGRFQQQRDYESAERLYGEALLLDPTYRLAYLHRGRVRLVLRRAEAAMLDLNEAIRLSSDDSLGFSSRGDALALCERFEEAIADYSHALELRPDNGIVRYNRAVAYRQAGRLDEAWNELALLVDLDPNNASLYLNRGLICVARGERDDAIREFRVAVGLQPESQEAVERLWELERTVEAGSKSEFDQPLQLAETGVGARTEESRSKSNRRSESRPISDADIADILSVPNRTSTRPRRVAAPTVEVEAVDTRPDHPVSSESNCANPKPKTTREIPRSQLRETDNSEPCLAFDELPAIRDESPKVNEAITADSIDARPIRSTASTKSSSSPSEDCQITIHCPTCQVPSVIRWDRLKAGKVLACRQCGGGFTTTDDGTVISVHRGEDGKWRRHVERLQPWYTSRVLHGSAFAAILAVTITVLCMQPTPVSEPALPEDLEPRAALFAEAWLKRDYRIIRRLTHPAQGPQLFAWHKKHPAPETKQKIKFAIEVVSDEPPLVTLVVRLDGLRAPDGSARELSLEWCEQNGQWLFLPNSEDRISSQPRTRADLDLPTEVWAMTFDKKKISRISNCSLKA